jgi:glyoxylase-like metal-dependent hydrolase (beta-lactamase superfamily II)
MRVHHINCGCMCPVGGPLFDGYSRSLTATLVCHCLLIETDEDGLVLVDTGFGSRDVEEPQKHLSGFFRALNNIQLEHRYTAVERVRSLGFSPEDVRHIVLTHLDFDHAGGLEDFPDATVHVMQREMDAARSARGFITPRRYRPVQWETVSNWEFYEPGGDTWFGFEGAQQLSGLPPELLFIPLAGHTAGHAGIAVEQDDGWLLHAGDAYFYHGEIARARHRCPPGLRFYQQMMEVDRSARMVNQRRLRRLYRDHSREVRIFCAHDAEELEKLQERQMHRRRSSRTEREAPHFHEESQHV